MVGRRTLAVQLRGLPTQNMPPGTCWLPRRKYDIPTAQYETFTDPAAAKAFITQCGAPIVVKTSGLAAGKGVIVAQTLEEAFAAVDAMMLNNAFGEAGGVEDGGGKAWVKPVGGDESGAVES